MQLPWQRYLADSRVAEASAVASQISWTATTESRQGDYLHDVAGSTGCHCVGCRQWEMHGTTDRGSRRGVSPRAQTHSAL